MKKVHLISSYGEWADLQAQQFFFLLFLVCLPSQCWSTFKGEILIPLKGFHHQEKADGKSQKLFLFVKLAGKRFWGTFIT